MDLQNRLDSFITVPKTQDLTVDSGGREKECSGDES